MSIQFAQKAIIIENGCLLLIQKSASDPYQRLKWEIPGGRLKGLEGIDEHIRREVKEEVGLEVQPGEPLAIWSWQLGSDEDSPTIIAVARRCVISGDRRIHFDSHDEGDHIGAWKWVPLDAVGSYDLIDNARSAILSSISLAQRLDESSGLGSLHRD